MDENSTPILLDKYCTLDPSKNDTIHIGTTTSGDSINRLQGIYTILTDGQKGKTSKSGTEFRFIGFKNSNQIISKNLLLAMMTVT